jgi:tetratricopeptide (TPR) repeat protein
MIGVGSWLKKALGKSGRAEAERLVTEGYVAARGGRHDDAERAYVAAIEADPTLAVAHLDAGLACLDRFNRQRADLDDKSTIALLQRIAAHLEQAIACQADLVAAWRALGHVRQRLGDDVGAEAAWGAVLQHLPSDPAHHEARATATRQLAAVRLGASQQRLWKQVNLALQPDASSDDQLHAFTELDATLKMTIDASWPPRIGLAAVQLGRRCGQLERARAHALQLVSINDRDGEALHELATLCQLQNDLAGALHWAMRAYRSDPLHAPYVCNVGVCHLGLGETAKAREYLDIARGMAPDDPIILRAHAACY